LEALAGDLLQAPQAGREGKSAFIGVLDSPIHLWSMSWFQSSGAAGMVVEPFCAVGKAVRRGFEGWIAER
jgi:hypothetical protein